MTDSKARLDSIVEKIKADDVRFVRFEQTDMYGVARSKTIPAVDFQRRATNGLLFQMSYVGVDPRGKAAPGTGYNEEIGFADGLTFPDLDTFITLPWSKNTGRILIEPRYKGKPVSAHPRTLARTQLNRLNEVGFSLLAAHEYEFTVAKRDTWEPYTNTSDAATLCNNCDPDFVHQLLTDLPKVGINVEVFESEEGPGQVEISYKPSFGIKSADTAHTFRTSVKEIALQHGYVASFMTKPWMDPNPGSSCHFNHSLWDVNGKENMMHDKNNPNGLSVIAQYWMAGILAHAPAISLLMAPSINCLKRYKPNSFAPINATWGFDNRSTALRVKEHGEQGIYVENRMGASGGNPYIAVAATVAAGIDGIRCQMKLPTDVKHSAYKPKDVPPNTMDLPTDMETALKYFTNDNIIREALGEEFCKCFGALKLNEIRMEREAKDKEDSDWERNLFFEYL